MPTEIPSLEEFNELKRLVYQQGQRIKHLESRYERKVKTPMAVKVTGMGRDSLIAEAQRPGTLIKAAKNGRDWLFDYQSLLDFNAAKEMPKRYKPAA